MIRLPFLILLFVSMLALSACATRVVQTRTIIIAQPTSPPVLVGTSYYPTSTCGSGCCGGYGYSCGRAYWSCTEYNYETAQCGFWEYRAPRWSSEVIAY